MEVLCIRGIWRVACCRCPVKNSIKNFPDCGRYTMRGYFCSFPHFSKRNSMRTPPLDDPRLSSFLQQWEFFCLKQVHEAGFFSTLFLSSGINEKNFIKFMEQKAYDDYFISLEEWKTRRDATLRSLGLDPEEFLNRYSKID